MQTVVVGQGYVGLPLAQAMSAAGLSVTGLDRSDTVVEDLNAGRSHIDDLADADLQQMLAQGYSASADPSVITDADAVIICVPTPLTEAGAPDLSAVVSATRSVRDHMRPGVLIVLESTTYPGTTSDVLLPILESSGLELDSDFHLAFSPERVDPGNATYGIRNTPKVVGGVSQASTVRASEYYGLFVDHVVPTRSSKEAETAKLLENTYRHINIALVNEMAKFCAELDIDIWDVIRAASTKPFGFQPFYPGPGVGGHCIPIDPNYLSHEVQRKLGYPFRFVELAQEINSSMPGYVVTRVQDLLNDNGRALKGSRVLLLGVTYKANISDRRESPALAVAQRFLAKGAVVSYHDPRVEEWNVDGRELTCVSDLDDAVEGADVVVLLQRHREYDLDSLVSRSRLLFDTTGSVSASGGHRL